MSPPHVIYNRNVCLTPNNTKFEITSTSSPRDDTAQSAPCDNNCQVEVRFHLDKNCSVICCGSSHDIGLNKVLKDLLTAPVSNDNGIQQCPKHAAQTREGLKWLANLDSAARSKLPVLLLEPPQADTEMQDDGFSIVSSEPIYALRLRCIIKQWQGVEQPRAPVPEVKQSPTTPVAAVGNSDTATDVTTPVEGSGSTAAPPMSTQGIEIIHPPGGGTQVTASSMSEQDIRSLIDLLRSSNRQGRRGDGALAS